MAKAKLQEQDYGDAAALIGCPVASVKAVKQVESRGNGFLPDDRPVILFERHIFYKYAERRVELARQYPAICNPKSGGYKGGAAEHDRLTLAASLDRTAALMSASWGLFQIMGFNFALAGFTDLQAFINAMYAGEREHLLAFIEYVKATRLDDELRDRRWLDFAKRYNGPAYWKNRYDTKLADAYRMFS